VCSPLLIEDFKINNMKSKDRKNRKLWGGRFKDSSSDVTEKISASIHFDSRLYDQDIRGSIAHAKMLNRIGILSDDELSEIVNGLNTIRREIEEGEFEFSSSLEDIHMNIEARLTERIGETGRKLHTARSRNDQISLDLRLYIRDRSEKIRLLIQNLISLLLDLAEVHVDVVMPGYTHLQIAQPVRFSHYLLAHAWALQRDYKRMQFFKKISNVLPLGSGALAGVNYDTDRDFLKEELGFDDLIYNSMDAVSDRDFVLDFLYFSSVLGMHLSRFCEDIVLWSSSEFGFLELSDRVTTGSSIMPQKKNPDIAELIRGKSGRLYGNLMSLLTTLKGLPLTYNRDLQEDKEPLFDSVDTVIVSLEGMYEILSTMGINSEAMAAAVFKNYSTATDIADYLSKRGIPFREAHEITGTIVRHCEEKGIDFFNIPVSTLREFSSHFDDDIKEFLNPGTSTERKLSEGSTSKASVEKQIAMLREFLGEVE
jgi:argininosuccinate lyase